MVTDFQLAQVNVARLLAPLDDPQLADFVAALDPINAAADNSPGFIWRLQTEDGNATAIDAFSWDAAGGVGIITNMSVWTDVGQLAGFVYGPMHREILRQRRQWFAPMSEAYAACWWVPAGVRPTTADAENRVRRLRADGPTPYSFTMRTHFAPPDAGRDQAHDGADDWLCPA
jgi:hypothetical protein